MVRVVVKRLNNANLSILPPGMTSSILEKEDKEYFEMIEESGDIQPLKSPNESRQV